MGWLKRMIARFQKPKPEEPKAAQILRELGNTLEKLTRFLEACAKVLRETAKVLFFAALILAMILA